VRQAVEAALGERLGRAARVTGDARVGGGCISPAARLELADGDVAFLKWGTTGTPPGLFTAEAAKVLPLPEVLAVAEDAPGWILLEWLEPGTLTRRDWEALGRGLAALHGTRALRFGWAHDNFIGSLPQENAWTDDWAGFWRAHRLEPQLRRAYAGGHFAGFERRRFDALLQALPDVLAGWEEDGASLVHGDLWSGNVHATEGGAVLIDPAAYYGHREVDLAMSELFDGFDAGFYRAYQEVWPLLPGYDALRRAVYQLYYLLVHVNLFGGGYGRQALAALATAGF
jgi:fructosamine-3-kinase